MMLVKGFVAGFLGTAVMSLFMFMKSMMGLFPELDPIGMLADRFGGPLVLGWVIHFMIGTIAWGGGFAIIYNFLPSNSSVIKGIIFGLLAWIAMMVVVMPMEGNGLFGLGLGIGILAPVMTMMLHVIFGAVMGFVFGKQTAPEETA